MSSTLHQVPSDLDIPLQVQVPAPSLAGENASAKKAITSEESVRAVLKYRNEDGRKAILAAAATVHHDFGQFNESLAVSLSPNNLKDIKSNPNVDWFEGDGRVIYCSIR